LNPDDRERLAAYSLEETAPKCAMNRHGRANDLVGLWIVELRSNEADQLHTAIPPAILHLAQVAQRFRVKTAKMPTITARNLCVL
jgi:hypothetical protein